MRKTLTRPFRPANVTLEEFGQKVGVHKSTVLRWERNGVPIDRLDDVERLTGIPRQDLRPDIFRPAITSTSVAA